MANKLDETTYSYIIEASFILNNKEIEIHKERIKTLIINYDYEKMFSPIMYMNINLPLDIYNKMQKNIDKGKMLIQIDRYKDSDKSKAKKTYIKKQFSYFFSETSVDEDEDNKDIDTSNSYRSVYIGLLDMDIINDNNNKVYNQLFKNSTHKSILLDFLKNTKIIMEPFDNNPTHSIFYVPPITGMVSLLGFMNQMGTFYNSGYRYFRDYNRAYLLSNKGKAIEVKESPKTFNSVHIEIHKKLGSDNPYTDGQVDDNTNKCHIIPVPTDKVKYDFDKYSDNMVNRYVGIGYDGNKSHADINTNKSMDSGTKPTVIKVFNDNMNYIKSLAGSYSINNTTITIQKAHINSSIICPHKEFIVKNEKMYKDRDGKYLLSGKTETFQQDNGEMKVTVLATFRKVV